MSKGFPNPFLLIIFIFIFSTIWLKVTLATINVYVNNQLSIFPSWNSHDTTALNIFIKTVGQNLKDTKAIVNNAHSKAY